MIFICNWTSVLIRVFLILSDALDDFVAKPFVQYDMREKFRGRRKTEELYFKCLFQPLADETVLYQVHWYIDGHPVFSSRKVPPGMINETNLTEENGLRSINVEVFIMYTL